MGRYSRHLTALALQDYYFRLALEQGESCACQSVVHGFWKYPSRIGPVLQFWRTSPAHHLQKFERHSSALRIDEWQRTGRLDHT